MSWVSQYHFPVFKVQDRKLPAVREGCLQRATFGHDAAKDVFLSSIDAIWKVVQFLIRILTKHLFKAPRGIAIGYVTRRTKLSSNRWKLVVETPTSERRGVNFEGPKWHHTKKKLQIHERRRQGFV